MKYNGIELEPITKVQAFEEPKKMLVWNLGDSTPSIKRVFGIVNISNTDKLDVRVVTEGATFNWYCAEIPKPQTTDMNSLRVMEYLHLLQLVLNNCEKTFIFPIEIDKMHKGVVVFNEPEFNNDWSNSAQLSSDIDDRIFKFGILKNGKVTEFKLPQVEVNN